MKIKNRDGMKGINTDWRYLFEKRFAKPYKKILCVGCYVYEPIEVGATHACDLTDKHKQRLVDNGFRGEFKIGDVRALPYEDKEFDCILCCEVLEHLKTMEDVKKAISEILRVGKNFLISVPYRKDIKHVDAHLFFNEKILKSLFPENTNIFFKRPFLYASNAVNKWVNATYGK